MHHPDQTTARLGWLCSNQASVLQGFLGAGIFPRASFPLPAPLISSWISHQHLGDAQGCWRARAEQSPGLQHPSHVPSPPATSASSPPGAPLCPLLRSVLPSDRAGFWQTKSSTAPNSSRCWTWLCRNQEPPLTPLAGEQKGSAGVEDSGLEGASWQKSSGQEGSGQDGGVQRGWRDAGRLEGCAERGWTSPERGSMRVIAASTHCVQLFLAQPAEQEFGSPSQNLFASVSVCQGED